jgi:hypothetical protein
LGALAAAIGHRESELAQRLIENYVSPKYLPAKPPLKAMGALPMISPEACSDEEIVPDEVAGSATLVAGMDSTPSEHSLTLFAAENVMVAPEILRLVVPCCDSDTASMLGCYCDAAAEPVLAAHYGPFDFSPFAEEEARGIAGLQPFSAGETVYRATLPGGTASASLPVSSDSSPEAATPVDSEGKIHRVDPDFGSTLTASNRDFQSNCWVNWKLMGQPCEFQVRAPRGCGA